ncbi:MAG TPA: hypothetical protein VKV27_13570 [Solirubrobacteraceae bacterium]|nr:hypothetical protein [Solirubrobacteraceae bacterium]
MRQLLRGLGRRERLCAVAIALTVLALNAAGWVAYALLLASRRYQYAGLGAGLGAAFAAWTLGCRHAFDADHIAAIDNCTRKLIADGRRPLGSGLAFALGHSSVVMAAGAGIAVAARTVLRDVVAKGSGFELVGGVVGTVVSGAFLWLIAALNVAVLAGILAVFGDLRRGAHDEAELEARLQARGLLWRLLGHWTPLITRTWQLYFVGCAFGIGFDTATEVLLLAATAAAATEGLPWFAVLTLPLLFAGGMALMDTADGLLMNAAYGWAFGRPVRRIYYNIVVTVLSIAIAFLIGGVEILGLLSRELSLHGWPFDLVQHFDINAAGYVIVGLFLSVWLVSSLIWRFARLETRWQPAPGGGEGAR